MDDTEFLSILHDAHHGLDPGVGWVSVRDHALTLIGERDHLREVARAYLEATRPPSGVVDLRPSVLKRRQLAALVGAEE